MVNDAFERFFRRALPQISNGKPLTYLMHNSHEGFTAGRFLAWVRKDPERKKAYEEAQAIAAELFVSEIVAISDETVTNEGMPLDVNANKLRIDTRLKVASVYNPSRFGDVKRVEMTTKHITDDKLRTLSTDDLKRLIVEGEYSTVEDSTSSDVSDDS